MLANVIDPRMDCNINRDTSQIFQSYIFHQWIHQVILIYYPKNEKTTRSQGQSSIQKFKPAQKL